METSTSDSLRFGKEWAENAAARALVWYVDTGAHHAGKHCVPMYAWEAITGKDFQWTGANYTVDADARKQVLQWAYSRVTAKYAHRLHAHSLWGWFDFFSPKQQQRIVEILIQRYSS